MVYKRKTSRGSYGVDKLQEVLNKVRAGEISKKKAELLYGVPKRTISCHLKGKVQKVDSLGRFACNLAPEFEAALVSHALLQQQEVLNELHSTPAVPVTILVKRKRSDVLLR